MNAHDVLAPDERRGPRLAREAGTGLGIARGCTAEELERHRLAELEMRRGNDDPHAPFAEDALDAVATVQRRPDRDRERLVVAHRSPLPPMPEALLSIALAIDAR
jgi:hypothetical protein